MSKRKSIPKNRKRIQDINQVALHLVQKNNKNEEIEKIKNVIVEQNTDVNEENLNDINADISENFVDEIETTNSPKPINQKFNVYLSIAFAILLIIMFISNTTILIKNSNPVKIDSSKTNELLAKDEIKFLENEASNVTLNHLNLIFTGDSTDYSKSLEYLLKNSVTKSPYQNFLFSNSMSLVELEEPINVNIKKSSIIDLQETYKQGFITVEVITDVTNPQYQTIIIKFKKESGIYKIYNIQYAINGEF